MEITIINKTKTKINKNSLLKLVKKLSRELKFKDGLSFLFCSDTFCKKINKKFLGRDGTTDVISFPINENGYLGDVLINLKQIKRQAKRLKISYNEELKRIVIHGILHLLGYDHEKDNGEMEKLQEKLLSKYKI